MTTPARMPHARATVPARTTPVLRRGPFQRGPFQRRPFQRGPFHRSLIRSGLIPSGLIPSGLLACGLLLSGCTSAVPVEVAPDATDPVCASVVLATPDSLGDGLPRRDTTSQATTAWGDPAHAVVLRCGVTPPGPTTEHCVTVATPGGSNVDWLAVPDDEADPSGGGWTFTTYGRVPAVEVRVPAEVAQERSTAFLDSLGPAVDRTEQQRTCL